MSCLGNRLGMENSHIWGLALRTIMSVLQWVGSGMGWGSWLYDHSFVLQSTSNNSVSIPTSFNNFFFFKLIQVVLCLLQPSNGVEENEREISCWSGSECEQLELLRGRLWQIRPVRWIGTTETAHGVHENDSLF